MMPGKKNSLLPDAAHISNDVTKGSTNISKTFATAEFPSRSDAKLSSLGSVFGRDNFIGGPVTTATIRFPPKYIAAALLDEDLTTTKYNYLKSLGRVVFARGPWIESHPLVPAYNTPVGNDDQLQDNNTFEDKSCYKTLAFGNTAGGGTSTFETVNGMIFSSSSSSALSYLNDDSSSSRVESTHSINRRISVVAFGGRRISFLSGGGLWANCDLNKKDGNSDAQDDFVSIPVAKTDSLTSSYLEISDWIHDVRLLKVELPQENNQPNQSAFLLAIGTMNNTCDIFGFHSSTRDEQEILQPTRLQCITCDVRCITYSLSFHGWDNTCVLSSDAQLPSLAVASGTVFSEIVVWDISQEVKVDEESLDRLVQRWLANITADTNSIKASRIRRTSLHRLKGHLGSIFSVHFSPCGQYIATTSDDRTVRLFQLQPMDESKSGTNWNLVWTGWGHTARVFDVSFVFPSYDHGDEPSHPTLVSAGEDGTARIWSPPQTKEVTYPLRGHDCESVWTVDVREGIIVTGGNDGCVKLWDLNSRMRRDIRTFVVPKDLPITSTNSEETTSSEATTSKPRKKQKKKPKLSGQLICGMELCKGHILVVATRAGGLFSLDIKRNTWTNYKCWHDDVISSEDESKLQVDPTTGTCISVSPSAASAILGTTEGWLVVASLEPSCDSSSQCKNAFRCPSYRPVQSISWVDEDNAVVFYARGSVIWFKMEEIPVPLHIMTLGTPGIPLSFAYDYKHSIYIGDSRGNLAYFDISQSSRNETAPTSVLKAHAKEHVTAVSVMKSGIIVSVGNDGCMHQSKVANDGQLHRLVSIPVPAASGLNHIATDLGQEASCLTEDGMNVYQPNGQENVILGGFYGNDYVVIDNINGYEFVRIPTGGRQKRQEFHIGFSNGYSHAMAICTGQKDGSNVIDFHSSQFFDETSALPRPLHQMFDTLYSIGHSYHAETINDVSWVKRGDKRYLLSGSNDCSVKLMKFRNNAIVAAKELPPHESCVRGVCTSSHPTTNTSLLVTCGGKLTMEFYLLDHSSEDLDSSVSTLSSYRTTGSKATIDHRMNVVRSVPLFSDRNHHLVVSGDSEGNLHVVMVSEFTNIRHTTVGKIL